MSIYLDYNASTPIAPEVVETMVDIYRNSFGNADSRTHKHGVHASSIVEASRKQVASLLGVSSDEVFFTSGATESNNIAILGLEEYARSTGKLHIVTSSIEHKSVLEAVKALERKGFLVDYVEPKLSGRVREEDILDRVRDNTLVVSLMHVNNETGSIQPVQELGQELKKRSVLFHVDATQSCGKLVEEIKALSYDMLSFSAHKFKGPQGIGCLILRRTQHRLPPIKPIMYGGQQEHGIRPGTIPVALTAGCGKACELAETTWKSEKAKVFEIRTILLSLLEESGLEYRIFGDEEFALGNTLNFSLPGISSEALMLSTNQLCSLSNGSACTSKSYEPSFVLRAMGVPDEEIRCAIRASWGSDLNIDELKKDFSEMLNVAKMMK